jgi:hypothetical protein
VQRYQIGDVRLLLLRQRIVGGAHIGELGLAVTLGARPQHAVRVERPPDIDPRHLADEQRM